MGDDFSAKYTSANLIQDASPYDSTLFLEWRNRLENVIPPLSPRLALAVLSAMLCAQRRGDGVSSLFSDMVNDQPGTIVGEFFPAVGEAVTLVAPFVGLPNVMPACFGMVGELKRRQIQGVSTGPSRPAFSEINYVDKGLETNARIYHGVGNSEVGLMIRQFFPDLSYWANTTIFGYLIGGGTLFPLKEAEIIVAAAIIALGATRQARSHCKAAMQLGNSAHALETIISIAKEMSQWSQLPLPHKIDLLPLVNELEAQLAKEA